MIEILNWNTGLTEGGSNVNQIIEYIKVFLEKSNSIAILQQIPLRDPDKGWTEHPIHKKITKTFSDLNYKIFQNNKFNNGKIVMITIIVTNVKNVVQATNEYYPNAQPTNRECAIKIKKSDNEKIAILGIHARSRLQNEAYLKSLNGNSDIIVGDFNAGDYLESENKDIFKNILLGHVCVCNLPTRRVINNNSVLTRESCIDHIFIKRKYITKCSKVIIHDDVTLSDHYPITFKFDI